MQNNIGIADGPDAISNRIANGLIDWISKLLVHALKAPSGPGHPGRIGRRCEAIGFPVVTGLPAKRHQ